MFRNTSSTSLKVANSTKKFPNNPQNDHFRRTSLEIIPSRPPPPPSLFLMELVNVISEFYWKQRNNLSTTLCSPLPPPPPLTSPPPHSLRTANCTRNHCRRRSQFTVGNVNILWHTLLNIVNIFFLLWYLMSFWLFFANCNMKKYVYCCNYQFPCTFPLPPPPPLTSPPPHSLRTANCTRNHCRRRSQFTVGNVNILWHTLLNIVNIFFLLWYLMSFWLFFANCNITKYVYCCNYQFPCTFLKSVTANFSPVNCELGL